MPSKPDKKLTGELHFRVLGESLRPGAEVTHQLVSVVGVLSVPKGSIENDQMLTVIGEPTEAGRFQLTLLNEGASYNSRGYAHGRLLADPIWRV
jgi:hypothetical protein